MCEETKLGSPSILTKNKSALTLLFVASGICFSYWFYGFLQEKLLTKSRLGATFILVIQTVANLAVAKVWQVIETPPGKTDMTMRLNHPLLVLTSACYVFAMVGSNESLRFVSYPVAVLAKSCKLIPTMVMGRLIERRRYSTQQWMSAICISSGIALFNYSRMSHNQAQHSSPSSEEDMHYWKGMVLLCISLGMDGFLGACQGRHITAHQNEKVRCENPITFRPATWPINTGSQSWYLTLSVYFRRLYRNAQTTRHRSNRKAPTATNRR